MTVVGEELTFLKRQLCDSMRWKWKKDLDRVFTCFCYDPCYVPSTQGKSVLICELLTLKYIFVLYLLILRLSSFTTTVKHIKKYKGSMYGTTDSLRTASIGSHIMSYIVYSLNVRMRMWLVHLPLYTTLTLRLYQVSTATVCILQAKARPVYSQMNLRQYWITVYEKSVECM